MFRWLKKTPAKKAEEEILIWKDEHGHELPYVFRPTAHASRPLLVILHGSGFHERPTQFKSDAYNILAPMDRYGHEGRGSWYLGEKGDFFILPMLLGLIRHIQSQEGLDKLYIWGSSMGGYAAILSGLQLEADAVFAHIPQTNPCGSAWHTQNRISVDFVFGNDACRHPWRNLVQTINSHRGIFPLFLLSFNRFDYPNYNEEQMLPLIKCLNEKNLNYMLLVHPQSGHSINVKSADLVNYFAIYEKEIAKNHEAQLKISQ